MAQPNFIYESPDGGKTVYRRQVGNPVRELHYQDPAVRAERELQEDNQLWHNIRVAALYNDSLAEMLEQIKVYYYLSNESTNKHQV